jgi:hypothetical protein
MRSPLQIEALKDNQMLEQILLVVFSWDPVFFKTRRALKPVFSHARSYAYNR